tara:strand:+ start:726 stop:1685 length:960 start_codon:yes stop_codon:yes gene_type:complete
MQYANKVLYNLPNDILEKICYKNNLDNKKLALLVLAHRSFQEFIMLKYKKLYLSSLQELQLNINDFINVYEVDIFNYLGVIDTYIFKNCKILKLRCCHNIRDVSQLGNVEYLDVAGCEEIRDVSMLGKCKYLDLSNCHKITNVDNLGNVEHLDLSHCNKLTNISKLGNHKYLSLRGCHKITHINNLEKVNTLDLSYCENINDISYLTNVYNLDVSYCPNIKINKSMNTVIFNGISTNLLNNDIKFLKNVKKLNIRNCYWIRDLSILNNIEILDIRGCKNIKKLPENNIKNISLSKELYNNNTIFNQISNIENIDIDYFN